MRLCIGDWYVFELENHLRVSGKLIHIEKDGGLIFEMYAGTVYKANQSSVIREARRVSFE